MSDFGLLLEMDIPVNKKYDEMTTEEKNHVDKKLDELYDIGNRYIFNDFTLFARNTLSKNSRNTINNILKIEKLINHPRREKN